MKVICLPVKHPERAASWSANYGGKIPSSYSKKLSDLEYAILFKHGIPYEVRKIESAGFSIKHKCNFILAFDATTKSESEMVMRLYNYTKGGWFMTSVERPRFINLI